MRAGISSYHPRAINTPLQWSESPKRVQRTPHHKPHLKYHAWAMYAPARKTNTKAMTAVVDAMESEVGPARDVHFQFSMLGMAMQGVLYTLV